MSDTTLRIIRASKARDIYRNRKFLVEERFPGGRVIIKAKQATRARAFRAALVAAAPQTSPTAAAGSPAYNADPEAARGANARGGGDWRAGGRDIVNIV